LIGIGNSGAVRSWFRFLYSKMPKFKDQQAELDAQKRFLHETLTEEGRDVNRAVLKEVPKTATRLVQRAGEVPALLHTYRDAHSLTREAAGELNAAVVGSLKAVGDLVAAENALRIDALLKERALQKGGARSVEQVIAEDRELLDMLARAASLDIKGTAIDAARRIVSDHIDATARHELERISQRIDVIDADIAQTENVTHQIALAGARLALSVSFREVAKAGEKLGRHARGPRDVLNRLVILEKAHATGRVFGQIRDYYVLAEREGQSLYELTRNYIATLEKPPFGEASRMRRLVESDTRHVTNENRADDVLWWSVAKLVAQYLERFDVWQTVEVKQHEGLLGSLRSGDHFGAVDDAMERIGTALGVWEPF
jgi:hypothetical protein